MKPFPSLTRKGFKKYLIFRDYASTSFKYFGVRCSGFVVTIFAP
ncbi:MAG: hypothetical protein ACI8WW_003038, partial [Oceanospirillaceae bacterium]